MKIIEVKFSSWDKPSTFSPLHSEVKVGDFVVVKVDNGIEIGWVMDAKDLPEGEGGEPREYRPILRKATSSDMDKMEKKNQMKEEAVEACQKYIAKNNLDMKLIDVHFSFDGGKITYAFTAEGRVDFRSLVKDLTRHFQKSIRLHQIGIRDEAKLIGDLGPCGRTICCKSFLNALESITSDMAELQQVSHRGCDRISGQCGRLMCCLKYEQENYEKLAKRIPSLGSVIALKKNKGRVVSRNILKQSVDVKLDDGTIVEVPMGSL